MVAEEVIGSDQILHIFKEKASEFCNGFRVGPWQGRVGPGERGGEEAGVTQKFLA